MRDEAVDAKAPSRSLSAWQSPIPAALCGAMTRTAVASQSAGNCRLRSNSHPL